MSGCHGLSVFLTLCWPVCLHLSLSIRLDACPANHQSKSILRSSRLSVFLSLTVCLFTLSPRQPLCHFISVPPVHPFIQSVEFARMEPNVWFLLCFHLICAPADVHVIVHPVLLPLSVFCLPEKMDCLPLNPSRPVLSSGELFLAVLSFSQRAAIKCLNNLSTSFNLLVNSAI